MLNRDRPAFPVTYKPHVMETGLTKGEFAEIIIGAVMKAVRFAGEDTQDDGIVEHEANELANEILEKGD